MSGSATADLDGADRPNAPLLERGLDLGDAGKNAGFVLFAAGSPRRASRTDHFVSDFDRNAAAHRHRIRNLAQVSVRRIRGELLELKRGLTAGTGGVGLEPAEL